MWLWISASAVAGPLDLPLQRDMGTHRCADRPVAANNNADLAGRTVTGVPPGAPVLPEGLALGPWPDEATLKRAARGRGNHALAAVTTLATGGEPVILGCDVREATPSDDFTMGCRRPVPCDLVATLDGERHSLDAAAQIGPRLVPVTSESEALGLVALVDHDLFVPLSVAEQRAWAHDAANYRGVSPEVPWVELETHEDGFVVRAPRRATCGCEVDVVRRAWWVSEDGHLCQLREVPVVLAVAVDPDCDRRR